MRLDVPMQLIKGSWAKSAWQIQIENFDRESRGGLQYIQTLFLLKLKAPSTLEIYVKRKKSRTAKENCLFCWIYSHVSVRTFLKLPTDFSHALLELRSARCSKKELRCNTASTAALNKVCSDVFRGWNGGARGGGGAERKEKEMFSLKNSPSYYAFGHFLNCPWIFPNLS